jgi:hypothetical protein
MERGVFERVQELGDLWPRTGAHILHVYLDETERRHGLLEFIAAGFLQGERICCVSNHPVDEVLADWRTRASGRSAPPAPGPPAADGGPFWACSSREFYLAGGVFDSGRVYRKWQDFCNETRRLGYSGLRAFGEVLPELGRVADGRVVTLYEMNLEAELQKNPPTCVVCQYDARAFKGEVLWSILRAHPLVLVGAKVCPNPVFEPSIQMKSH